MATNGQERKVALITGATGGIGKATAIALAKEDSYDLALHYSSASQQTRDALSSSIKEVSSSQLKITFFQADMGNYDSVRQLYHDVSTQVGQIDVLYCNAGTTGGQSGVSNLSDVSIDVFEQTWRINTGSAILLTQLCLPHMESQSWGRIIFCSSVAAFTGGMVGPHYASSKSAQHGFVHWLASRVASKGVSVNAVAPALIGDTAMMGGLEDEATKKKAEALPIKRPGKPEEVAATVVWMIKTGFVTNKVVTVDGGMYPY